MRMWRGGAIVLAALGLIAGGCQSDQPRRVADDPQAMLELLMPEKLVIESFTKPVSFNEKRSADGIEIIARAVDAAGDPVKVPGTFTFELYGGAGGRNRVGQRYLYWTINTAEPASFNEYWERFGRFYRFLVRFELDGPELPPGPYRIEGSLTLPSGKRLTNEFEFNHAGSPVPPAAVR
ncbi:MAG: hypothetical protein SF069_09425 [Phycisphaerae bacterium]|nr:hypothetical protein [Phycisphaerae bacterium]